MEEEYEAHWSQLANCATTDPEAFFPPPGGSHKLAKKVCDMCIVQGECLVEALSQQEQIGFQGGLSAKARRAILQGGLS